MLAALEDLGFDRNMVELHDQAVPLVGFEGNARLQRAHIVIRRQHVGRASNDIGFERTPTGYRAWISDYDRSRYGSAWMARLQARYEQHEIVRRQQLAEAERQRMEAERRRVVEARRAAVHEKARELGYGVEESRQGDKLRLVLVRRSYT